MTTVRVRRARPPRFRVAFRVVLLLAMLPLPTHATTYRFMTPSELLAQADVVFTARVVDVTAAVRDDKAFDDVYTTVRFDVEEVFRGYGTGTSPDPDPAQGEDSADPNDQNDQDDPEDADDDGVVGPPTTIELDFLGGEASGDRRLLVAGSPSWRTGETVLIAAYLDPDLASPLAGFRQGVWRLTNDAFIDVDGRPLGLDPNGRLARTDLPGAPAEVLAAVEALLSGEAPVVDPEPEAPAAAVAEQADDEPAAAAEPDAPTAPPAETEEEPAAESPETPAAAEDDGPVEPIAVAYRVDDAGGPLLLSDAVATAAAEWEALAGEVVELTAVAAAENEFGYGEPAMFSPETLSLTLVRGGGPSEGVTALLSPAAGELLERALRHELGLMLGLPAGGLGVMSMAVADSASLAGEAELAELAAVNRYGPADLSRDGAVDFLDLLEFAVAYGRSGLNLPGDLDADGDVDDDDLAALRESYQLTPPSRPE